MMREMKQGLNWERIRTLCGLYGTSGREDAVRRFVLGELERIGIPGGCIRTDRLGNILVEKKGAAEAKRRVLFSAHMDEVALIVTDIHADGSLGIDCVGGVTAGAVIGRQVYVGKDLLPGVIGCRPVHLLSPEEKKRPAEMRGLYCDIGTGSAEETKALVRPGDIVYFPADARDFGDGSFVSKAIDDRFGCAVLLELLERDLPYDTAFLFAVQEEVGLRGAGVAAAALDPEIAVVLEATTAADLPDSQGTDRVCALGGGAVISFMDGRTVYDRALYDMAAALCEEKGISWQTKTKIAGGNDAGAIQSAGHGARVLAVSVPCRYLHAPASVIRKQDAEACLQLAEALACTLQETDV